ncbi:unnamed protein product [Candidula unifasciata]|uniref:Protein kinase domain-containing protein n=1 Tax=Candidula unifasciata TaxID=100452 RepID=A0A8S3YGJ3_9EUPU|nr:unnamed protein product [Candidula unifasciata]
MTHSIIQDPKVVIYEKDFFTKCHLRPETVLDKGLCGQIVLASLLERPDTKFIVKKFCLKNKEKKARHKSVFKREVKFMQSLAHDYLTTCIAAARCPGYLAIFMKYYGRGTLDLYVGEIGLDLAEQCVLQVACALRYMHKNKLVHLDVKLDNIFLDEQHDAVLGDFGMAAELKPGQQALAKRNIGGTSGYFAPEWIAATKDVELDPYKLDSYSLGVVLWSLVFEQGPEENIHYYYETRKRRDIQEHIRDMLLRLLNRCPGTRITITDLLARVRRDSKYRIIIDNN